MSKAQADPEPGRLSAQSSRKTLKGKSGSGPKSGGIKKVDLTQEAAAAAAARAKDPGDLEKGSPKSIKANKEGDAESGGEQFTHFSNNEIRRAFVSKVYTILSYQLVFTAIVIGIFIFNK